MAITVLTAAFALAASTPQTYGSITPQFDSLDVFVDLNGQFGNLLVEVFAQGGIGGVNNLVASAKVGRNQVTDPSQIQAIKGIGIIGGTTYTLVITADTALLAIKASMSGYNAQVNQIPDETDTVTAPLVFNTEVPFGALANYHIYVQANVDFGPNNSNTESIFRLYGTAGAGGVKTLLFSKRLSANPNSSGRVQQVISLPNDFQAVGCDSFEMTLEAVNVINVGDSHPTVTLIGFDPLLDGTGGSGPVPPLATQALAASLVYRPGGVAGGNVFVTEPTLKAAWLTTVGDSIIDVDDSIVSPAPFTTVWPDAANRLTIKGFNDTVVSIDIADGAQFTGVNLEGPLNVITHGTVVSPFDQNTATQEIMIVGVGVTLTHLGSAPWMSCPVGGFRGIIFNQFTLFDNSAAGAGPFLGFVVGGGGGITSLAFYNQTDVLFTTDHIVDGGVGTTIQFEFDSSWPAATNPNNTNAGFTGTTTLFQGDNDSKTVTFLANGNFTVPDGVTEVDLEGCGAGGGGGGGIAGAATNQAGGGAGAGALLQKRTITGLVARSVIAVGIGTAGAGGAAGLAAGPGGFGGNGTVTTFGGLASFDGGSGGLGAQNPATPGLGGMPYIGGPGQVHDTVGAQGTNLTPMFQAAGGAGGSDTAPSVTGAKNGGLFIGGVRGVDGAGAGGFGHGGGGGGAGPYGAGGAGGTGANNGASAVAPAAPLANSGAGGGGGGSGGGVGQNGAAGADGASGMLKVTWRVSP